MQAENSDLRQLGSRARSGRILSEYIRGIANELTEVIIDEITLKPVIVSKGEALARKAWNKAFGRSIVQDEDGKTRIVEGDIDIDWVKIILDRVEGKPGVSTDATECTEASTADKVSSMNLKRLNAMASAEPEKDGNVA